MTPSLLALREELGLEAVDPEEAWAYIENSPVEERHIDPRAGFCEPSKRIDRPAFDIPAAWRELLASDSGIAEIARARFEAIYEALEPPSPVRAPRRRLAMGGKVDLSHLLGEKDVA